MLKIDKKILKLAINIFSIIAVMFLAFGIVGPTLVSANSYILVAVGFTYMIMSVVISIWLLGLVIKFLTGENNE